MNEQMKVGDGVSIETGGDLQPPLLPRTYRGVVTWIEGDGFAIKSSTQEAPITFTRGDHLLITVTEPYWLAWDELTDEQRYWFSEGWRAKRDSTEPEPQFAYESIHDLPTEGAAA